MRAEDQILLTCARQGFGDDHRRAVRDLCAHAAIDWELVYATASVHNIAPLVALNLQQCDPQAIGIATAVWAQFEAVQLHSIALASGVAVSLQKVLAYFAERNIDIMLIKGAALSFLVYAEPWYTLGDVDLVVKPRRDELSERINAEIDLLFARLYGFEYDFWAHHDVTMNGILPVDFARIWADAAQITYRGQPVLVMCPEDMLLAACINSCRKRYTRLKSMMDIAEIVAHWPELQWQPLVRRAREYGCEHIVYAALYATHQALGTVLSDRALSAILGELDVSPVRARVIQTLAGRAVPTSYAGGYAGPAFFGRSLASSLVLPYATLHWYQVGRRIRFVWNTRARGATKVLPGLQKGERT